MSAAKLLILGSVAVAGIFAFLYVTIAEGMSITPLADQQSLETKIKTLITHQNLRDTVYVTKLLGVTSTQPLTRSTSRYDKLNPKRVRYVYDDNDLYSFNLLRDTKGIGTNIIYIMQAHGDNPPTVGTVPVGVYLSIDRLPKDSCIFIDDLRDILTFQGMKEIKKDYGDWFTSYDFEQSKSGIYTNIAVIEKPSHKKCVDSISFTQIEHHYTKEGAKEYNDAMFKAKGLPVTPEKIMLLNKIRQLVTHKNWRDIPFVSKLFGFAFEQLEPYHSLPGNWYRFESPYSKITGYTLKYLMRLDGNEPLTADSGLSAAKLRIFVSTDKICLTLKDVRPLFTDDGVSRPVPHAVDTPIPYVFSQDRYKSDATVSLMGAPCTQIIEFNESRND